MVEELISENSVVVFEDTMEELHAFILKDVQDLLIDTSLFAWTIGMINHEDQSSLKFGDKLVTCETENIKGKFGYSGKPNLDIPMFFAS